MISDLYMLYSLGNTLFLDPLVERQWLPNVQQWADNFNVRMLLLDHEYAAENPEVCYHRKLSVNSVLVDFFCGL